MNEKILIAVVLGLAAYAFLALRFRALALIFGIVSIFMTLSMLTGCGGGGPEDDPEPTIIPAAAQASSPQPDQTIGRPDCSRGACV